MDQFFIKDLQQKYLNFQDDSMNISSDHQEEKYIEYIEADLQKEETLHKDDFRHQIEQRFKKSKTNQTYQFPRLSCSASQSEDSFRSLITKGVYDLAAQTLKPTTQSRNQYKTVSTELQRKKDTPEIKNKRLKTEGNDDGITNTSHYQFHSESDVSEDVIRLGNKPRDIQNVKKKSKVPKQRRRNSSQKYQSILDDLQKKLEIVNLKENSQQRFGKLLNLDDHPISKPQCFYDCERLYGQSKAALKRTTSSKRNGSTSKSQSRQLKTSQGYYEPHDYYDISNYNTRIKSNSNSNTEITRMPTKSSSSKKPGNFQSIGSDSRNVLSKNYLQQNNNLASKYRNKLAQKRPETQQDVSRPNMTQPMLTHDYLLQILNSQQSTNNKTLQKQSSKPLNISTKVHNPVFNLNNSNINFNLNFQGTTKLNKALNGSELLNQTMAVAELIRQQKQKPPKNESLPRNQKRCLSSQQYGNSQQRFRTDPNETIQPIHVQRKQLETLLMQKVVRKSIKSQSSSRCNTENQQVSNVQTNSYINCLKQAQTVQARHNQIPQKTLQTKKYNGKKIHHLQISIDPSLY